MTVCTGFDRGARLSSDTTNALAQAYAADPDANPVDLPSASPTQPVAAYDQADELTSSAMSGTTTKLRV